MEGSWNPKQITGCSSKGQPNRRMNNETVLSLKSGSYNPRSINNKTIEVIEYLKDHNLDIILVQESWLRESDSSKLAEIQQHGYEIISNPRNRLRDINKVYKMHNYISPLTYV